MDNRLKLLFIAYPFPPNHSTPCVRTGNIVKAMCEMGWKVTVVIARTEKGKNLLEDAVRDGAVELEHLPVEDIIRGQTVDGRHKTKFFTAKSIYIENGWMFPYDEKLFAKDAYVSADKKEKATIKERLEYSRKLYSENEALKVRKMIAGKKRSIQKEALVSYPLRLVKRGLRFLKNSPKKIKKRFNNRNLRL